MTLYIGHQHPVTVYKIVIWVCVFLVLSGIRCSCYYFLLELIFIMIVVTIVGIFKDIHYFLNYTLGFR